MSFETAAILLQVLLKLFIITGIAFLAHKRSTALTALSALCAYSVLVDIVNLSSLFTNDEAAFLALKSAQLAIGYLFGPIVLLCAQCFVADGKPQMFKELLRGHWFLRIALLLLLPCVLIYFADAAGLLSDLDPTILGGLRAAGFLIFLTMGLCFVPFTLIFYAHAFSVLSTDWRRPSLWLRDDSKPRRAFKLFLALGVIYLLMVFSEIVNYTLNAFYGVPLVMPVPVDLFEISLWFVVGQISMHIIVAITTQSPDRTEPQDLAEPSGAGVTQARYAKSALNSIGADRIKKRLHTAMCNEKMYKNPFLSLPALSEHIGSNPHRVSQVLNTQMNMSFYAFLNYWRIKEAKRLLLHQDTAISEIALAVGYNSRSTFNAAFKAETGHSPSTFRRQHRVDEGVTDQLSGQTT
ncbi:helix-turn-helix transcriptional regulator [Cognatiyoonia sp. IB215182]|uniref:helix-turn-helix domain-containing protein n=1 Tax=Cognatiyoonia sp. IB215182 TaxID=3097353 RepID=UPI002A129911|nr:helix-turn-helix transcriptional regulator [Cognatiyoonia sp. IB215182]MDX8352980.1 helix-turn-helix transcriptional regulator [Cognatiyoonia sp. IB215182]